MSAPRSTAPALPVKSFRDREAWAAWLGKHHAVAQGIWLRFAKQASGKATVVYAEALDVALCYGWIDGLAKSDGDEYYVQKFTPRTKRSIWSKRNCGKALALIASGAMQPAGLAEVERAKQDGRWERAYDSPSKIAVPDDLQAALDRRPRAKAFFATLDAKNRYAILFRTHNAKKPETRARRIAQFVEMLAKKQKIYP